MPSTTLKRLIAVQNAHLAEINSMGTRFREKARSTLNKNIVQARLDAIIGIWAEARKTHVEIVTRDDANSDPYVIDNVFARMQCAYEDTLDYFLTLKTECEAAAGSTQAIRTVEGNASGLDLRPAKLPKLDLPTFSGRYEDWDSFCDLFTTLVHDAPRVADATKLQYLKSCLKGVAADLVKDVASTSANYASTWLALRARFHNPRLTVTNHLNALLKMNSLKRESADELRSFADEAQRIVRALRNLQMPVEHWDIWFVHVLASRLDPESRKDWESELSARDREVIARTDTGAKEPDPLARFPKFSELAEFLERRAQALSMMSAGDCKRANTMFKPTPVSRKIFHANALQRTNSKVASFSCTLCSGPHFISKCPKFLAKSSSDRRAEVRRLYLCFNCMGGHKFKSCPSSGRCRTCQGKHHSLLHYDPSQTSQPSTSGLEIKLRDEKPAPTVPGVSAHTASLPAIRYPVILATAQVNVVGPQGTHTRVRALLDQGAEASFVSEAIVQLLALPKQRVQIPLTGLGSSAAGTARFAVKFTMQSLVNSEFKIEAEALVLSRLTSQLPTRSLIEIDLEQFGELSLADPHFNVPDSVDLILGADLYGQLLRPGLQHLTGSRLVAQNTVLGWVISGSAQSSSSRRAEGSSQEPLRALHCASEDDLNECLQQFWRLEELPSSVRILGPEDEACENQFVATHSRDAGGRYVVQLPLKSDPPKVSAETRRMAVGSLAHIHRKFTRDPELASAYREFMRTYEALGHMTRVPAAESINPRSWYLPHHAVVQSTPTQYKVRVVFDASRRTHEQYRLNDFLMSGPPLQQDLSLVLLNWRRYKYVFTADIVKMFRQILVVPRDQDLQRIVWAPNPEEPPIEYRLTTVTYGTACAPYLAIRTLAQLAVDEKSRFPLGARCLESNVYVDDMFIGADELPLAIRKRTELIQILGTAGIELDKWAANHPDILPAHKRPITDDLVRDIVQDESIKTLGVHWKPTQDEFSFSVLKANGLLGVLTKRAVLSNIARLFDPLGWLSPITITAKILMQDLWILKCDWDSPLPAEARGRWIDYCRSLSSLPTLTISRWFGSPSESAGQIHGFSDASSRAYAAVIYLRTDEGDGHVRVSLLAAKTRVAPVKTVSIPNLELCGALLLVRLVCHLRKLDFLKRHPVFLWSDSRVVLAWLNKHPCHWKTFVANRVSLIQTELPSATWAYVPTKQNPADCATRGSRPSELHESSLWWYGPSWLNLQPEHWPQPSETAQVLHAEVKPPEPDILSRHSTLTRLIRVVAYCLRPVKHLRRRKGGLNPLPAYLTTSELSDARSTIIRLAQAHAFASEIERLKSGKPLPKSSALRRLNPLLDKEDGILRVGGRLSWSNLTSERKHPPILPRHSGLSRLFVRYAHHAALHGGPTLTSSVLLRYAWVVGGKSLVKTAIRNCLTCQRVKPRLAHQLMGDLPAARVTPARPFTTTGLDYAGPFHIRTTKGRGHRAYKGYIALFVCFATRAIHLELVSDLTASTFIAAYRRFVSRRGICHRLYSDNATTFKGADTELRTMFEEASEFYQAVASTLANDGTAWSFIPPTTPHYGGLWEAGVKSVKHHLRRVVGEHTLTFEEFSTVLTEIGACLNSRPLCPLTSDTDDLNVLTPAHFLIGTASALVPDAEPSSAPENRLNRFQLLQRIRNQFWKRWSDEYLQHLQERGKWRDPTANFAVGQLVLMRDERYPPAKWHLGRVIEVHPGSDGLVRVVTVKTATNTFRRHIARLCPLILESEATHRLPK
ncbi:uncharacterized protein LOC143306370 [Osmia lignaria lignaria]|uniref:uncharacterized protein LOC143306370 n=1 Tax=Osmia lignaria lignaria TaxID=1437193 RepID=UPI00402B12E3